MPICRKFIEEVINPTMEYYTAVERNEGRKEKEVFYKLDWSDY